MQSELIYRTIMYMSCEMQILKLIKRIFCVMDL